MFGRKITLVPSSVLSVWSKALEIWHEPNAVELLHGLLVDNARLNWFDMDLHHDCNLTCDHCFYHDNYSKHEKAGLAQEHLEEVLWQALSMGVKVLTFSGMEPTLGKHFNFAIETARKARVTYGRETKIGLITNGLTLAQHLDFLRNEPVDFIDVSIDGWEWHNRIRANTRDKVLENFKQAKAVLPNTRVGTSTVVRNDNVEDVLLMIVRMLGENEHFYFEPVVAGVDKHVPILSVENVLHFAQGLQDVAEQNCARELHLSLLLNGEQALPLFYHGMIKPEEIWEDENGSLFVRKYYGDAEIIFILRIVPEYYWRSARLSYDGYWLGTCDLLQAPDFREVSCGNFTEMPSIRRLFSRALTRPTLFFEMIKDLFQNPCVHTEREQQYCLSCFSARMVKLMHERYGVCKN